LGTSASSVCSAAFSHLFASRVNPDGLVDCLVSTFGKGPIDQFRKFLAKPPQVTKWMIATDYVTGDPQAAHDA
jgi:hypothetical protein